MTTSFENDFADFERAVTGALIQLHGEATADSPIQGHELASELASKSPLTLAHYVMARSAHDIAGAQRVLTEGLETLLALEPNALAAADPYKTVYRILMRRAFPSDIAFADGTADRASVSEARQQARIWADRVGVRIDDLAAEAEALRTEEAAARAEAERRRREKSEADRQRREEEYRRSSLTETFRAQLSKRKTF